jgi:hypothetical protein
MNSKPAASGPESKTPKQTEIDLAPEYAVSDGVKFEYNGLLLIPAPGESERLEREKPVEVNPVCIATPAVFGVGQSHYHGYANTSERKKITMNAKQMHRLRTRNA